MMVMAAALAKLIFARVMMTSKFWWWWATTWQSDDWFQMQCAVKRGHLMAMNLPKRGYVQMGFGGERGQISLWSTALLAPDPHAPCCRKRYEPRKRSHAAALPARSPLSIKLNRSESIKLNRSEATVAAFSPALTADDLPSHNGSGLRTTDL